MCLEQTASGTRCRRLKSLKSEVDKTCRHGRTTIDGPNGISGGRGQAAFSDHMSIDYG